MSSRNLFSTRARRTTGVSRHAGKAADAAFTAASTSAAFANGTERITSPVDGLATSPNRPLFDVAAWPLIQSGTRAIAGGETAAVLDIVSSGGSSCRCVHVQVDCDARQKADTTAATRAYSTILAP